MLVTEPPDPATMRGLRKQLDAVPEDQSLVSDLRFPASPAGRRGLAVRIVHDSNRWGWLILSDPRTEANGLEALLCLAAGVLALRLELEEAETLRRAARADQQAAAELLTSGEAMSGLVHELNNSLNSMLLQAAVVQMKAYPALRNEVAAIRSEGAYAAARLNWVQRQRERCRLARDRVDLGSMVQEVLLDCPTIGGRVKFDVARDPVVVAANPAAVRRLLASFFCVIGAVRTPAAGAPVSSGGLEVQTLRSDGQQGLRIRAAPWGPGLGHAVDLLGLEEDDLATEHVLERLAARSLARLADATIDASLNAAGELAAALMWSAESDGQLGRESAISLMPVAGRA